MDKPIILLDVDGPLNPFAAKPTKRPEGYETHLTRPSGWVATKPLKVWLNPLHGPALMSLGYDIIWCTAWNDDANEWIGPHIGLPKLEVMSLQMGFSPSRYGLHWKTEQIADYMVRNHSGRDFVWIDDESGATDLEYLQKHIPVRVGLFKISPQEGLKDINFEAIRKWKDERS